MTSGPGSGPARSSGPAGARGQLLANLVLFGRVLRRSGLGALPQQTAATQKGNVMALDVVFNF